jgi:hypothetical protein
MSESMLYLVQREPPSHRRCEVRRLNAVCGLNPVLPEVHRQGIPAARFHQPEPLPLGHVPQPVLADLSACVHAGKRTSRDARRYTDDMTITEDGPSLPVELLGNAVRYAVYRCYSDLGELLYIGETGELGTRLASHAQKLWFVQVRGITLEWYADEADALKAERRAIHVEHPKYNKQHRNTTSVQVSRAKARKRGLRPMPANATNDELAILVLRHIKDTDVLNSYRVAKVIKEQYDGMGVGHNRSKVILELARQRVVPIGDRKTS